MSWRFTCLKALFVSHVQTTNVWGQQSCTMLFAVLEMIVYFNVVVVLGPRLFCERCFSVQKTFLLSSHCFFFVMLTFVRVFLCLVFQACMCVHVCACACVCVVTATAALEVSAVATCGIPLPRDQMERKKKRYMVSHCFPINTSPGSAFR